MAAHLPCIFPTQKHTVLFADGVFKNPVNGVGSLPPSRVLAAARRGAVPICLCLAPALLEIARHVRASILQLQTLAWANDGHRSQNRPVDAEKR